MSKIEMVHHPKGASRSRLTIGQIVEEMCFIQEELQIKGYDDLVGLLERVTNRVAGIMMSEQSKKDMVQEKNKKAG